MERNYFDKKRELAEEKRNLLKDIKTIKSHLNKCCARANGLLSNKKLLLEKSEAVSILEEREREKRNTFYCLLYVVSAGDGRFNVPNCFFEQEGTS